MGSAYVCAMRRAYVALSVARSEGSAAGREIATEFKVASLCVMKAFPDDAERGTEIEYMNIYFKEVGY